MAYGPHPNSLGMPRALEKYNRSNLYVASIGFVIVKRKGKKIPRRCTFDDIEGVELVQRRGRSE